MQVLRKLRRKPGEIKGMDRLIRMAPWILSQIIRITHVDIPKGSKIRARAAIKSGVGFDAGVCLGWTDTEGYHMVGVRGKLGLLAKVGGDLMAGLHHDRRRVKAIVGYGNLGVEIEFKLRDKAKAGVAGVADASAVPQILANGEVPATQPPVYGASHSVAEPGSAPSRLEYLS
jgi:hypothetical protein